MPASLRHVTLDTGHERTSPRTEVADATLQVLAPIVADALDGERPTLPTPSDRHVTLRIDAVSKSSVEWEIEADGWTLAECRLELAEPEPVLHVSLGAGLLAETDAAEWLGDAERCIAWALIDAMTEPRSDPAS